MKRFHLFLMFSVCFFSICSLCFAGNPWDWSETIWRADEANRRDAELRMRMQQMETDRRIREEQLRLQRQEMEYREAERRQKERQYLEEQRRQEEIKEQASLQKKAEQKPPPVFDINIRPILLKAHPDYEEIINKREYWEWVIKQSPALLVAGASSHDPQDMIWALSQYKAFKRKEALKNFR